MIKIIPAEQRHCTNLGWLKTCWLFAFSDYYDPANIQFGALRVFNDDIVAPQNGFPDHPHSEMEIVTMVLEGELTHEDTLGNEITIKAGEVQRITAGTGLEHSEFNLSDKPVHLYQIWVYPNKRSLKPGYDQKFFSSSLWKNKLFPVASGQKLQGAVSMHSDSTIYRSSLEKNKKINFAVEADRKIFIYLTDGEIEVNGMAIKQNDQARIEDEKELIIQALNPSSFVLIDVPPQ